MKTFKIENTPFFESKDQYLTFRQAWKSNFKNSKPTCDLNGTHHLIYAALRGRDISKCFTPITTINKLHNGMQPYSSYLNAKNKLNYAKCYMDESQNTKPRPLALDWFKKETDNILAPFHGTITVEMIIELAPLLLSPSEWKEQPNE